MANNVPYRRENNAVRFKIQGSSVETQPRLAKLFLEPISTRLMDNISGQVFSDGFSGEEEAVFDQRENEISDPAAD